MIGPLRVPRDRVRQSAATGLVVPRVVVERQQERDQV